MPQLSSADEVDPEVPLHQHSTIRNPAGGRTTSRGDRGAHERTARTAIRLRRPLYYETGCATAVHGTHRD